MAEQHELGKEGEALALAFLQSKGYEILEKNWLHGKEEVDIIAMKDGVVAMVEVKTRRTRFFGDPEVFVNKKKQRHLVSAADAYLQKNNMENEARFDIISVLVQDGKSRLNHITDAFYPTL